MDGLLSEKLQWPWMLTIPIVHVLELEKMDISTGDFPVEQLSNAIIKSSMIDYACKIYMDQRKNIKGTSKGQK